MPLNITTNSAAASAGYYLGKNQSALQKSLNRLASGKKIIAPYDDPGSLSVSMKLEASINRLAGAQNNVRNGISFLEVQDGVLAFAGRIVDRMAEIKGLSSQDPMKSSLDQASYNDEFRDLQIQLYQMSQQTFNGVSLFAQYATDSSGQPGHKHRDPVSRWIIERQHPDIIHQFRRQCRIAGECTQSELPFSPDTRLKYTERIGLLECRKQIRGVYIRSSRSGFHDGSGCSVSRGVHQGTGEHSIPEGSKRRHHVETHFFRRDDFPDADQYDGRTWSDRRCRYRRREYRTCQESGTGPGIRSHASTSQLHHRYSSHASQVAAINTTTKTHFTT